MAFTIVPEGELALDNFMRENRDKIQQEIHTCLEAHNIKWKIKVSVNCQRDQETRVFHFTSCFKVVLREEQITDSILAAHH